MTASSLLAAPSPSSAASAAVAADAPASSSSSASSDDGGGKSGSVPAGTPSPPSSSLPPEKASAGGTAAAAAEPQHSPYEHWVRRLYQTNLFQPVKMGLDNIERLHGLLGRPMDDPRLLVVHVAGTNGKGSVCLKVARALELHGLRTGLFVSPHVSSFRERMQVGSAPISEEQVVRLLPEVYRLCEESAIPATFFEITTALAFSFFREEECQAVVLETGLGGRLDATNVVAEPALAVITSIGLEHTRILGDTVEKIAAEKAGIVKPGRPVLVGPHVPHGVVRRCAAERRAGRYYTVDEVLFQGTSAGPPNDGDDPEDYDVENTRIAVASLQLLRQMRPDILGDLSDDTVAEGTSVRPPCRFEVLTAPLPGDGDAGEAPSPEEPPSPLTVILDVAHNPPAMQHMVRKLRRTYPAERVRVVVGMSSDKDLRLCGESLLEAVGGDASRIHLVEAAHPRAAKLEAMLGAAAGGRLAGARYDFGRRSVTEQMADAMRLARAGGEVLVVCGSVFLMAEAREALGIEEPRDSACIAEVAGAGFRHSQENFGGAPAPGERPGEPAVAV